MTNPPDLPGNEGFLGDKGLSVLKPDSPWGNEEVGHPGFLICNMENRLPPRAIAQNRSKHAGGGGKPWDQNSRPGSMKVKNAECRGNPGTKQNEPARMYCFGRISEIHILGKKAKYRMLSGYASAGVRGQV